MLRIEPIPLSHGTPQGLAALFPMPRDKLLTYQAVAERFGSCTKSVQRWSKTWRKVWITRTSVRIPESEVEKFIKAHVSSLGPPRTQKRTQVRWKRRPSVQG
jgi:hypothetical protein